MVDIGEMHLTIHALMLKEDQYESLVEAREAMFGDDADTVTLGHTVALLARQEINRDERDYDTEQPQ